MGVCREDDKEKPNTSKYTEDQFLASRHSEVPRSTQCKLSQCTFQRFRHEIHIENVTLSRGNAVSAAKRPPRSFPPSCLPRRCYRRRARAGRPVGSTLCSAAGRLAADAWRCPTDPGPPSDPTD